MQSHTRTPGRVRLALVTTAMVATTLTACGTGGDQTPTDEVRGMSTSTTESPGPPVKGGELTVALEAESASWLPGEGQLTTSARNVAYALFDPLVVTGDDGAEHPYLAASVTSNPTLDAWTVTLRPGIRFHDGTPLDAHVMKDVFDRYLMAPTSTTLGLLDEVAEFRVDGLLTFTYILTRPNGAFPSLLTGPVGWPFSPAAADKLDGPPGSRVAGTGPFRLESWTPDDNLVVVRNEAYWREGLPHLDKITFRPVPDEQLRVDTFLAGGFDAMQSLRGRSIKAVIAAEDRGFTAHTFAGDDAGVAVLNTAKPPFDDQRIRRAAIQMVDPMAFVEVLGDDGLVDPSTQFFGVDSPWHSERVADARWPFDPDMARLLVEQYTLDPDRSDGLPVGTPPNFEYVCLTDAILIEVAQVMQQAAAAVGFNATTRHVDTATLVGDLRGTADSDPPFVGTFDTGCFRSQTTADPAATFGSWFGAPNEEAANITNFTTPELVALINELRRTADFDRRYALVEQIGLIINREVPIFFVSATPTMIGTRVEVKNVSGWTTPEGRRGDGTPFGVTRWGEVWLDQ